MATNCYSPMATERKLGDNPVTNREVRLATRTALPFHVSALGVKFQREFRPVSQFRNVTES